MKLYYKFFKILILNYNTDKKQSNCLVKSKIDVFIIKLCVWPWVFSLVVLEIKKRNRFSFYFRFSESILIPLPKNLLTLGGSSPLVWQVQVLVTSLLPPRIYLHHAGVAWEGLQEFVHRKVES